jgi:heme/copper-type cytochrome/quinol oxidase subunit 1
MRLLELIALLSIGALAGGAYLLGWHPWMFGIEDTSIDRAFHDTYYIEAQRDSVKVIMAVALGIAAMFVVVLMFGQRLARTVAAVAAIVWPAATALAVWPQHFLADQGMPRRYIDYTDAYQTWNLLSAIGSLIALVSALSLGVLVLFSLWQRFTKRRA